MNWIKIDGFFHQTHLSICLMGCLVWLNFSPLQANEPTDTLVVTKTEAWDISIVNYRQLTPDTIAHYRSLTEYQYEVAQSPESFWSKLWQWLRQFYRAESGETDWLNIVLQVLAVVTFTVIVVYLYGVKVKGLFSFSRNIKNANSGFTVDDDNINDSRLDNQLKNLVQNRAWREATRLMYLICLREMNNYQLIAWDISKTNRDYYYELPTDELRQEFRQMVLSYEYVWYGNFPIDELKYEGIKVHFDNLQSSIQTKKETR